MKRLTAAGFVLSVSILTGSTDFAAAQMTMAENTMFVAQLDAKQVVGGSSSKATGTGAFLIDGKKRTLAYSLTYEGLSSGRAGRIALYNFGRGKNGGTVRDLCGGDAKPCPEVASATIAGRFESGDGRPLDNQLLGEFASERVYVEIIGGDGKPEIRGQLEPNTAMVMVMNYTVNLTPAAGTMRPRGLLSSAKRICPGGRWRCSTLPRWPAHPARRPTRRWSAARHPRSAPSKPLRRCRGFSSAPRQAARRAAH